MAAYLLRRLAFSLVVLLGLTVIVFIIARVLPGDPVRLAAGPNATAEQIRLLAVELGFDRPLPLQYLDYLKGLLVGDWGISIYTRRPVLDDLLTYLPATVELVMVSLVLALAVGIPVGILTATRKQGVVDHGARLLLLFPMSTPRFLLGYVLQITFAVGLAWLPLSGRFPIIAMPPPTVTGFLTVDSLIAGDLSAFGLALQHLALPAITTAISPMATIAQVMRSSMIEVLSQDYIRAERAVGMSERTILFKYAFKNAATATLTTTGLFLGWMLGGTVLVETVFSWPGIGLYATQSMLTQDFMPIIGVTLSIAVIFLITNTVVDILYGVINPQARAQ